MIDPLSEDGAHPYRFAYFVAIELLEDVREWRGRIESNARERLDWGEAKAALHDCVFALERHLSAAVKERLTEARDGTFSAVGFAGQSAHEVVLKLGWATYKAVGFLADSADQNAYDLWIRKQMDLHGLGIISQQEEQTIAAECRREAVKAWRNQKKSSQLPTTDEASGVAETAYAVHQPDDEAEPATVARAEWKDDCLGLSRVVRCDATELPIWLSFRRWSDSHRPIDDSPEAICEWIEHALARVNQLALWAEDEDHDGREMCRMGASSLVPDCYILVEHLRGKGWQYLPSETARERTIEEASIELRRVRDAIADQLEPAATSDVQLVGASNEVAGGKRGKVMDSLPVARSDLLTAIAHFRERARNGDVLDKAQLRNRLISTHFAVDIGRWVVRYVESLRVNYAQLFETLRGRADDPNLITLFAVWGWDAPWQVLGMDPLMPTNEGLQTWLFHDKSARTENRLYELERAVIKIDAILESEAEMAKDRANDSRSESAKAEPVTLTENEKSDELAELTIPTSDSEQRGADEVSGDKQAEPVTPTGEPSEAAEMASSKPDAMGSTETPAAEIPPSHSSNAMTPGRPGDDLVDSARVGGALDATYTISSNATDPRVVTSTESNQEKDARRREEAESLKIDDSGNAKPTSTESGASSLDDVREWIESRLKRGQKQLASKIIGGVTNISALDDLGLLGASKREYPSAKYQDRVRHINEKLRATRMPWKFVAVDNEAKVIEFDWNSESSVNTR